MIRPATLADAGIIHACAQMAFQRYVVRIGREPAPMQADPVPAILRGEVYVAIGPDDGILGYVTCQIEGRDMALDALAVWPEQAGRGAGRTLVAHVESLALDQGLDAVTLYTNAAMVENLPFYEGLGYIRTGRRWQDGFDRVFFRKPLGPGRLAKP